MLADGKSFLGITWPYLWSAAAVSLAAGVGLALTAVVRLPNVSMVFLLAVLFSAARFGIGPALLSSVLSFLTIALAVLFLLASTRPAQ